VKRKKVIEIKDPQLQKIRNNLRLMWISAVNSIVGGYLDEQRNLLRNRMNSFEMDQYAKLVRKNEKLRRIVNRSICKCLVCQKADRDMVFNPITKVWFCVHCYELNREYYKHTKDARFYP